MLEPASAPARFQELPDLPVDGWIDIRASNRAQQRGPHGVFRYFGKLAPDVTDAVLRLAAPHLSNDSPTVVDVMCGSGTTLVAAGDRGWSSVGIDCNPVAVLYARCKTQQIDRGKYDEALDAILRDRRSPTESQVQHRFVRTRNADRWFDADAQREITRLLVAIDTLSEGREQRLLFATMLSRLRKVSRASERTGRIFFDAEAPRINVREDFAAAAQRVADSVPRADLPTSVHLADARNVGLPSSSADLVFCHPPYFALYRYSADVLRFELEIGGFDRRAIATQEVREGWKSGDIKNLDAYIQDMGAVFKEARRVAVPGGIFAVIASNSTLGDVQLSVIEGLADAANAVGWTLVEHHVRVARHGSAVYHRSARADKIIGADHVLLFTR